MGKKGGGIRKRMMESEQEQQSPEAQQNEPGSSSHTRSIRQRMSALASSSAPTTPSPLAGKLMRQWAKGKLTALQVQELALSGSYQSEQNLEALATAGSSGKKPAECTSELDAAFRAARWLPGDEVG